MTSAAKQLTGRSLPGGWKVISPAPVSLDATGGHFSEGYIVQAQDGKKAFLKALDYSSAMAAPDPARQLQALTEAFNFERDVLNKCRERNMDRVVMAITDGKITIEGAADGGIVQYLIFELADGDVRSQADVSKRFDLAWSLRALHHIATGLWQLHKSDIAHQDLKPSNVLVFNGRLSKVGDLGRAAYKGHTPLHDQFDIPGDPAHAPPELLYGYVDPDWNCRRFGCDAYLLGSMVTFFFSGAGMTPLIRTQLHDNHCWGNWSGTYDEVLPYVRDAFGRAVDELAKELDTRVREDIVTVARQLCEPDPRLRGHPINRMQHGNQYSMERYVSTFDLLAYRAEIRMLGR